MKRVLVFGTFDRLHKGHEFFLGEARKLGDHLTVCLAQDEMVKRLKGHSPKQGFNERSGALKSLQSVDEVLGGDSELGAYSCLKKANPDIVAIGYDQISLKENLEPWLKTNAPKTEIKIIVSHKPEIYKSSLLADTV